MVKTVINRLQITIGQHHVTIQNDDIFTASTLDAVVANLTRAAVLLGIILQIKDVCVLVANILAWFYRTVFNNNYFEILKSLFSQSFE